MLNREPIIRALILKLLLAAGGAIGLALSDQLAGAIASGVAGVVVVVLDLLARRKVTPINDPRDDLGRPLAPAA